ncbi:hypothetical protein F5X68DRAFT_41625 [Plectosphaerella plurivora]|uniref:Uncharacterized protein n=1 Tax=Plectosphaerella plurivora TaxID=936078 RepID=A0A9P9A820_9PEZI|nr:hypothetical protein F5X68DRAFT_41625 [Plectosphaerella plurivora]
MSAVASLHFDPTFTMGGRNQFNPWPVLDHSDASVAYMHSGMHSLGSSTDATSLTPPLASRSVTSSPPRAALTPQQRELKRQRDQIRRESKASVRAHRASSNPYLDSPTLSVSDVPAGMGVPIYSTAPTPLSLLAEPVPNMAASSYMPPYSSPVPEPSYSDNYSTMVPNYNMGVGYANQFPPAAQYTRSPPVSMPSTPMYGMDPTTTSSSTPPADHSHVRVVQSRPKPQCWEHGCNGRQFSTFSNLLRHQREKSGQAAKSTCPNCGAEFTRTTARNGHMLHDKCKQRRNS